LLIQKFSASRYEQCRGALARALTLSARSNRDSSMAASTYPTRPL